MGPRIRFTSSILPPYLRRAKSIEELLPWLYLKGISTGDFSEALAALLGPEAPGLSASTIVRLKEVWQGEMEHWQRRDLSARRYVYFWADGILLLTTARRQAMHPGDHRRPMSWAARSCWRSPTATGRAPSRGAKCCSISSAAAWRSRPSWPPATARSVSGKPCARSTGRRASSAVGCTRPPTCSTSCRQSVQPRAKQHLQDIWMAETKRDAEKAFDFFLEAYGAKYDKAVACLAKDRDVLLAFYDFPAEHWKHIRTTNPIESTFATVRLRTTKTKGCLSRMTALTMVFKLCQSASKKWRPPEWLAPHRRDHSRCQIQGRRKANRTRRLKPASPTFDGAVKSRFLMRVGWVIIVHVYFTRPTDRENWFDRWVLFRGQTSAPDGAILGRVFREPSACRTSG